jgi:hypothetical protein
MRLMCLRPAATTLRPRREAILALRGRRCTGARSGGHARCQGLSIGPRGEAAKPVDHRDDTCTNDPIESFTSDIHRIILHFTLRAGSPRKGTRRVAQPHRSNSRSGSPSQHRHARRKESGRFLSESPIAHCPREVRPAFGERARNPRHYRRHAEAARFGRSSVESRRRSF